MSYRLTQRAERSRRVTSAADQLADRKRKLAAIHAAAAELGMDTADKNPASTYRTMLKAQAGVVSAADLDEPGRRRVLAFLLRELNPGQAKPGMAATQAQMIERLWAQLATAGALKDPSPAGLAAFVKGRCGIDSHLWLPTAQANLVIEALKAWKARAQAKGRARP